MSDLVVWHPSAAQRLAKAKFWSKVADGWRPPESYSLEEVAKLTGTTSVRTWGTQLPDFWAWFFDKDTDRQRLAAESGTAIEALLDVIASPVDPKSGVTATAKVRAAEVVLQYAGMKPATKLEATTKTDLGSMDPSKLREMLAAQVKTMLSRMTPEQMRDTIGADNLAKLTAVDVEELSGEDE